DAAQLESELALHALSLPERRGRRNTGSRTAEAVERDQPAANRRRLTPTRAGFACEPASAPTARQGGRRGGACRPRASPPRLRRACCCACLSASSEGGTFSAGSGCAKRSRSPSGSFGAPFHPRAGEELRPTQKQSLLSAEVRRPCEPVGVREAQVRAQRLAHRLDEPVNPAWQEPILPPDIEHVHASLGPVDPRLDPADEAIPEKDRQHVPAPTALGRWEEELPYVLELEQAPEEAAIPDDWVERRDERDGRRRVRRSCQQFGVLTDDKAFSADALHLDGKEITALDELFAQSVPSSVPRPARVRLRGSDATEDISATADTEQTVRAVPR